MKNLFLAGALMLGLSAQFVTVSPAFSQGGVEWTLDAHGTNHLHKPEIATSVTGSFIYGDESCTDINKYDTLERRYCSGNFTSMAGNGVTYTYNCVVASKGGLSNGWNGNQLWLFNRDDGECGLGYLGHPNPNATFYFNTVSNSGPDDFGSAGTGVLLGEVALSSKYTGQEHFGSGAWISYYFAPGYVPPPLFGEVLTDWWEEEDGSPKWNLNVTLTPEAVGGAPPTVTSIAPDQGPASGGTDVTITGTNFVDVSAVTIGGSPCGNLSVDPGETELSCTTPPGTAGLADVEVTNPGGTGSLIGGFTYLTPEGIIEQIIAEVMALEEEGVLNSGQENSLIKAKLAKALEHLALGETAEAIQHLQTFINQVEGLTDGVFTEEQEASLTDPVNQAIALLGSAKRLADQPAATELRPATWGAIKSSTGN